MQHVSGLSLQGRALLMMVLQLEHLAGPEAVLRLHVVLHVNDGQVEETVKDLWDHGFYG